MMNQSIVWPCKVTLSEKGDWSAFIRDEARTSRFCIKSWPTNSAASTWTSGTISLEVERVKKQRHKGAVDALKLGVKQTFDHNRLLKMARVLLVSGRRHICYRDKESEVIYDMFHTRLKLHRLVRSSLLRLTLFAFHRHTSTPSGIAFLK